MYSEVIVGLSVGALFVIALGYFMLSERLPVDISGLSREEQRAVRIALADDRVMSLLDSKHVEVKTVQVGGVGSGSCQYLCAIMIFAQIDHEDKRMLVIVDMTSAEVVTISASSWS